MTKNLEISLGNKRNWMQPKPPPGILPPSLMCMSTAVSNAGKTNLAGSVTGTKLLSRGTNEEPLPVDGSWAAAVCLYGSSRDEARGVELQQFPIFLSTQRGDR